jgi:hypothetical protein
MCAAKNVIHFESIAMEAWQCVVCAVELDISLPKIRKSRRCQSEGFIFSMLTKFGVSKQIRMKVSNIKFHKNPCSGRLVDTYRQTERRRNRSMDGQKHGRDGS